MSSRAYDKYNVYIYIEVANKTVVAPKSKAKAAKTPKAKAGAAKAKAKAGDAAAGQGSASCGLSRERVEIVMEASIGSRARRFGDDLMDCQNCAYKRLETTGVVAQPESKKNVMVQLTTIGLEFFIYKEKK